ncbi:hypothetical protein GIB67_001453, partial [Kingdonia uniflora]
GFPPLVFYELKSLRADLGLAICPDRVGIRPAPFGEDFGWLYRVDLFFYREPEETKEPGEGDIVAAEYGGITDCQTPAAGDQWSSEVAAGNWDSEAPPPITAVSVANKPEWTAADHAPVAGEWDTAAPVVAAAVTEVAPSTSWD